MHRPSTASRRVEMPPEAWKALLSRILTRIPTLRQLCVSWASRTPTVRTTAQPPKPATACASSVSNSWTRTALGRLSAALSWDIGRPARPPKPPLRPTLTCPSASIKPMQPGPIGGTPASSTPRFGKTLPTAGPRMSWAKPLNAKASPLFPRPMSNGTPAYEPAAASTPLVVSELLDG